jgi:RNA polymerase sigma-54 factor
MKAALQARMSQQIGMTPQLLQSIRMLHLNALEIEHEVARALEENPLLERVDADADGADDRIEGENEGKEGNEADVEAAADAVPAEDFDDFVPGEFAGGGTPSDSDPFDSVRAVDASGIRGCIRNQMQLELDDPQAFAVVCWILDHTGDAGYLEIPRADLCERAAQEFGVGAEAVEALRQRILRCEPAGFAACDLRECLLAQLAELPGGSRDVALAVRVLAEQLETLARGERDALGRTLGATAAEIDAAVALILTLDPKPGLREHVPESGAIVPDVIVRRRGNGWHVALCGRAAPRLRVGAEIERLLAQCPDGPGTKNMRERLLSARWFVRSLAMRNDTLLRTARAIVARQADFLEHGEEQMRPMILREIAGAIGMHESSVSRITSGKYIQTPRGTFELKYFFSAALEGSMVAGVAVRALVKRLIDTENHATPLADDTIVALLARRNIHVARRTVAKYRDILHIASAKERAATRSARRALRPALAAASF